MPKGPTMNGTGNKQGSRFWSFTFALGVSSLAAVLPMQASGQDALPNPSTTTHVVRPGDTLWDLSRQYLNSPIRWHEIQRDNSVSVPELLRPGQVLTLGGAATVIDVVGDVTLTRPAVAPQPVSVGSSLEAEDMLMTGRTGFVAVELSEGSRVVVPSNTTVKLVAVRGQSTRLELLDGRLEAYVEKRKERDFEIRTRTVALGVKGTHFRARSDSETSTVEVLEGTVLATELAGQHQSLLLVAGQGASLEPGVQLRARALLPGPQQILGADRNLISAHPVDGAVAYQLSLARDPNFLRLSAELRALLPEFGLPSDLAPGFYHARFSAFDSDQIEGEPGRGIVFVATGNAPDESAVRRLTDGTYEIRWTTRQSRRHTFELAYSPDFSQPLVRESGNFAEGVRIGQLESPGFYFWRCREEAEQGAPPQSVWGGSFEVPSR